MPHAFRSPGDRPALPRAPALTNANGPEPLDRGARLALSLGCAIQCLTLAWIALRNGTAVDGFLFVDVGWSEGRARTADLTVATLSALGALTLVPALRRPAALGTAVAALAVAVADTLVGGRAFSDWSVPAAALRWLGPVALIGFARPDLLLRVATAAVFAVHGREALGHHPQFIDLVIGSARRLGVAAPSEAQVETWLLGIGALDVGVAALLLFRRWPALAFWAAAWGAATAAARTMALGPEFLDQTLVRALHGLGPLALALHWRRLGRTSEGAP